MSSGGEAASAIQGPTPFAFSFTITFPLALRFALATGSRTGASVSGMSAL
jgi:hypothetical protein